MENIIKPIIINPFETEKERQDCLLVRAINTGISMCKQNNKLEDILSYLRKSLEQLEENEKEVK